MFFEPSQRTTSPDSDMLTTPLGQLSPGVTYPLLAVYGPTVLGPVKLSEVPFFVVSVGSSEDSEDVDPSVDSSEGVFAEVSSSVETVDSEVPSSGM